MTSPFAQPGAGGDKFEPATYSGALLLVYPHKYVTGIPTKFGEADAVEADIVVLDRVAQDGQPLRLNSTMIFQNKMVGQVKGSVGGMVLGRLGQGLNTKGNPPWELLDHTAQDVQVATQYIAAHPAVSQPSQTQSAPAPVHQSAPPAYDPWAVGPQTTPPQTNGWGAPPAAPVAPTAPSAAPAAGGAIDPQLVQFLQSKGIDMSRVPDEATARNLAATFGA